MYGKGTYIKRRTMRCMYGKGTYIMRSKEGYNEQCVYRKGTYIKRRTMWCIGLVLILREEQCGV